MVALHPSDAALVEALRARGFDLVHSPGHLLDTAPGLEDVAAVVVDADVPGTLAAVARMRRFDPGLGGPVLCVGAESQRSQADELPPAMALVGANAYLRRPVAPQQLLARLEALLRPPGEAPTRSAGHQPAAKTDFATPPRPVLGARPGESQPFLARPRADGAPAQTPATAPVGAASPLTLGVLRRGATSPTERGMTPPGGQSQVAVSPGAVSAVMPPSTEIAAPALRTWIERNTQDSTGSGWRAAIQPGVREVLRGALDEAGVAPHSFIELEHPGGDDGDLDQLVPPELLEPLEAPLESDLESTRGRALGSTPRSSPGLQSTLTGVERMPGQRRTPRTTLAGEPPSGLLPLSLDGDLQLSGRVLRFGAARVLGAAAHARCTGALSLRAQGQHWQVFLDSGHVLSLVGQHPGASLGQLMASFGYIPHEAVKFAEVPLDAGPRGAALLAAHGYVSPDGLPLVLGRLSQEVFFDLLRLDDVEWSVEPLGSARSAPLATRSLEALMVLGARARIEPALAWSALGGDDTVVTFRAEPSRLGAIPLYAAERAAVLSAHETAVVSLVRSKGEAVLPALAALVWLQLVRAENPSQDFDAAHIPPGAERSRVKTFVEAAARRDLLSLLGVSPWATRAAARACLEARRAELDALRQRYGIADTLKPAYQRLEEAEMLMSDHEGWERLVSAVRAPGLGG
ncbi:MAG: hypothetical protein JNK72_19965 [Myxococcales bacterium]|nr:hypothetical protein [Myxococcales bacterium]